MVLGFVLGRDDRVIILVFGSVSPDLHEENGFEVRMEDEDWGGMRYG